MKKDLDQKYRDAGVESAFARTAAERAEQYLIAARVLLENSDHAPPGGQGTLYVLAQIIATADRATK